jgi:hypothetical protein
MKYKSKIVNSYKLPPMRAKTTGDEQSYYTTINKQVENYLIPITNRKYKI